MSSAFKPHPHCVKFLTVLPEKRHLSLKQVRESQASPPPDGVDVGCDSAGWLGGSSPSLFSVDNML